MPIELRCKCGHEWIYKGKSEHYATCPRCHNLVNVKKARGSSGLTPEEIAVLDRADNEPPEGSPHCDPWADIWICRKCWGGAFESFMFAHAPTFCPLCGVKNTLVRSSMVPDWSDRIKDAAEKLKK